VRDVVEITSLVGRRVAERWRFPLSEWLALERDHPNPVWWKREFVANHTAYLEDQPGGSDQAVRIRDGQVSAIDAAVRAAKEAP
jgi:hypothetical protein